MKKGKRLLVILVATLLMVFGAVSTSFAHGAHEYEHNWELTANGDTATLRCLNSNCNVNDGQAFQVTIEAPDAKYTGEAYKAHVTTTSGLTKPSALIIGNDTTGVEVDDKITYVAGPNSALTDGKPVNVGEYTAKIVVEVQHYKQGGTAEEPTDVPDGKTTYTIEKTFRIEKAPITIKAEDQRLVYGKRPTTNSDGVITYTIEGKEPTTKQPAGIIGDPEFRYTYNQYDPANYQYSYGTGTSTEEAKIPSMTDVKYKVSVAGLTSNNYDITLEDGELKVVPKTVRIDWKFTHDDRDTDVVAVDGSDGVVQKNENAPDYDGRNYRMSASVAPDTKARKDDEVTVTLDPDTNIKEKNVPVDDYSVSVKGLSNTNYTLLEDPLSDKAEKVISAKLYWRIEPCKVKLKWKFGKTRYNAEEQTNTAEIINLETGDDLTIVYGGEYVKKDAGNYEATASIDGDDQTKRNYSIDSSSLKQDWEITKAPLTAKVTGGWITYGDSDGVVKKVSNDSDGVDITYEGLIKPDSDGVVNTENASYSSNYEQYKPADTTGKYNVTVSGLSATNYEITAEQGALYVYPKPVDLEWFDEDDASKTYEYTYDGQYHKVVAKVKSDGIVNKDKVEVETYTGDDKKIDSCKKAKVDKYTVKATELDNPNYTLLVDPKHDKKTTTTTDTQDWKILQLPAEFKWFNNETGEEIVKSDGVSPEATFVYNGKSREIRAEVANKQHRADTGEDDTVKVKKYDGNGAKDSNAKASTPYQAVVESLDDDNYTLDKATRKDQRYWIDPLPIELKWKYGSTVYNGKDQTNIAKITNLVLGDDEKEAALTYDGDYTKRDVGHYTAKVKEVADKNYTVEGAKGLEGPWDITKATVAVKANNNEISYGDDPKDAGYKVSGLKGGDKINIRTVSYTYDYKKYGKPGYYKINPVVDAEANPNYDFVYEYGVLTVKDKVTTLKAKAKAKTTAGKISWNKVAGAKKYQVFIAQCNTKTQKFKIKKVKTVKAPLKSCTVRKLKRNTFYKFYVVALDGSGKKIAQTKTNHFCTGNSCGNLTNPKTIKASKHSVSVKAGGKYKLSAKVTKVRSDKKLATAKNHASKVRYISEMPKVAKVDKNGKITGVSAGWCRIYVVGVNGIWDTIEVNVK